MMKLTKEQVEMIKGDAESAPFKHGYDMTIIELCTDWLEMNNEYNKAGVWMREQKRIMGRFCVSCKWWQCTSEETMEDAEFECKNKDVLFYAQGNKFNPWATFGCNEWEAIKKSN